MEREIQRPRPEPARAARIGASARSGPCAGRGTGREAPVPRPRPRARSSAPSRPRPKRTVLPRRRELRSVREQVDEDLDKPARIRRQRRQRVRQIDLEMLRRWPSSGPASASASSITSSRWTVHPMQRELPRLDAHALEQVVDQPPQAQRPRLRVSAGSSAAARRGPPARATARAAAAWAASGVCSSCARSATASVARRDARPRPRVSSARMTTCSPSAGGRRRAPPPRRAPAAAAVDRRRAPGRRKRGVEDRTPLVGMGHSPRSSVARSRSPQNMPRRGRGLHAQERGGRRRRGERTRLIPIHREHPLGDRGDQPTVELGAPPFHLRGGVRQAGAAWSRASRRVRRTSPPPGAGPGNRGRAPIARRAASNSASGRVRRRPRRTRATRSARAPWSGGAHGMRCAPSTGAAARGPPRR